ncbi:hypothetical protein ACLB2K_035378 [Fragaria x ananassa]
MVELVALEPRPLLKGRPFSTEMEMPTLQVSSIFMTSMTAISIARDIGDGDLVGEDLKVDGEGDEVAEAIDGTSEEVKTRAEVGEGGGGECLTELKGGLGSTLRMVGRSGGRGDVVIVGSTKAPGVYKVGVGTFRSACRSGISAAICRRGDWQSLHSKPSQIRPHLLQSLQQYVADGNISILTKSTVEEIVVSLPQSSVAALFLVSVSLVFVIRFGSHADRQRRGC